MFEPSFPEQQAGRSGAAGGSRGFLFSFPDEAAAGGCRTPILRDHETLSISLMNWSTLRYYENEEGRRDGVREGQLEESIERWEEGSKHTRKKTRTNQEIKEENFMKMADREE